MWYKIKYFMGYLSQIKYGLRLRRVVRWNAHRKSMWYCPTCNKALYGEEVTYQETHNIQYNGYGEPVE